MRERGRGARFSPLYSNCPKVRHVIRITLHTRCVYYERSGTRLRSFDCEIERWCEIFLALSRASSSRKLFRPVPVPPGSSSEWRTTVTRRSSRA